MTGLLEAAWAWAEDYPTFVVGVFCLVQGFIIGKFT